MCVYVRVCVQYLKLMLEVLCFLSIIHWMLFSALCSLLFGIFSYKDCIFENIVGYYKADWVIDNAITFSYFTPVPCFEVTKIYSS